MSMDEAGFEGVGTPLVVVGVIVMNGSALLLGKDANTKQWTLPKGGVTKFQGLQDVGQTAVFETTGISVQVTGSIFVSEEIIPPNHHHVIIVCLGKPLGTGDTLAPIAPRPDIFSEVKWVDFRELGEIQDDVDNVTADAIMKFGLFLQSKQRGA